MEQIEAENEELRKKLYAMQNESKACKRENDELKKERKLKKKFVFSMQMF